MKLIQSLSESRMLASTGSYHRFTARQIAELVYLHVIALRILASESMSHHFAHDYALRSARYLGFAKWYQNATDLHLLIHALVSEDVELKMPEASQEFKETLYFDDTAMRRWLKNLSQSQSSEAMTRTLFMHLDGQFRIKDSSAKAIRRLVQDWPHNTERQKQLAMTRLLQMMRVRARGSDLLSELERVAKALNLELHDVANQETGDVEADETPHKKGSLLKRLVAGGLAAAAGYQIVKAMNENEEPLSEDDGGGATTSANVAPVVVPLGAGAAATPKRRRNSLRVTKYSTEDYNAARRTLLPQERRNGLYKGRWTLVF